MKHVKPESGNYSWIFVVENRILFLPCLLLWLCSHKRMIWTCYVHNTIMTTFLLWWILSSQNCRVRFKKIVFLFKTEASSNKCNVVTLYNKNIFVVFSFIFGSFAVDFCLFVLARLLFFFFVSLCGNHFTSSLVVFKIQRRHVSFYFFSLFCFRTKTRRDCEFSTILNVKMAKFKHAKCSTRKSKENLVK